MVTRQLRTLAVTSVLLLGLGVPSFGQQVPSSQPGGEGLVGPPQAPPLEEGPSVVLTLPRAISESDLQRYAQILMLSEAQVQRLIDVWSEYRLQWERQDKEHLSSIRVLARAVASSEQGPDAYGRNWLAAMEALNDAESMLAAHQKQLDAGLFEQISPMLSEEQQPRMLRVTQHRERSRAEAVLHLIPAARIDLASLVQRTLRDMAPDEQLDSLQAEYELRVTPVMDELRDRSHAAKREQARLLHEVLFDESGIKRDFASPDHPAREATYHKAIEEVQRGPVRLQLQIASVNRAYLPLLAAGLPAPLGKQFTLQYQRMAYPQVYPDPLDATDVLNQVLEDVELTDEQRLAIGAVRESYLQGYNEISHRMEEAADDQTAQVALTQSITDPAAYRAQMRELRDQRWMKTSQVLDQIETMLPTSVRERSIALFVDFRTRMRKFQQIATNDRYPM